MVSFTFIHFSKLFPNTPFPNQTEDPYYCGLRARVPNFAKSSKKNPKELGKRGLSHPASMSNLLPQVRRAPPTMQNESRGQPDRNPALWHARSYESGIGESSFVFCLEF